MFCNDVRNRWNALKKISSIRRKAKLNGGITLIWDVDGTLNVFETDTTLDTVRHPGYFANRDPQQETLNAARFIQKFLDGSVDQAICTACFDELEWSIPDKNQWIDKYIPFIPLNKRMFVSCSTDKLEQMSKMISKDNKYIFIDDRTLNLRSITSFPNITGVKCVTDINDTHKSWSGKRIFTNKGTYGIINDLLDIIVEEM